MSPALAARGSGETPPDDRIETTTPPTVEPDVAERSPREAGTGPAERPATLPLTGGSLVGLVLAGSAAICGGAALLRRGRAGASQR